MKQKHKEFLDQLKELRNQNQRIREKTNNTLVMDDYLDGKVMAFNRAISLFNGIFSDELAEESK